MKLESAWALSSPSGVTREDKVAVIWSYFHDEILKCDKKVWQKHGNTDGTTEIHDYVNSILDGKLQVFGINFFIISG